MFLCFAKQIKGWHFFVICFFLIVSCNKVDSPSQESPKASQGVTDLRGWDFTEKGSVYLDGEWFFLWEKLVYPDQIRNLEQASLVSVPDVWTNYDLEGLSLQPHGYSTYYLTVYLPDIKQTGRNRVTIWQVP